MDVTVRDYLMGRDQTHPLAMTPALRANAQRTVDLVQQLVASLEAAKVPLDRNPGTGSIVSSGWRPPALNAATAGAAVNSLHMTCEACDLYDPDGLIDDWLMSRPGQDALTRLGLWMEHPAATKGWAHVQARPPRSGRRIFYP